MPPGDGTPDDDYPLRVQRAVAGYVRGQLLFSVIMGTSAGVALCIFGVARDLPRRQTYALAFGVFFGLMELMPYIGPVLGAVPPILVALFQDPLDGVWVALLFVALQQLEGHIVAPQIFGHALRINPLLVIFALLFGGAAVRHHRRAGRAAGRGGPARDGRLPAPPRRARAVGDAEPRPARPRPPERPAPSAPLARCADAARRTARRLPPRSRRGLTKRYGEREALRERQLRGGAGELRRGDRPQRRRQDDAAVDPRRHPAPPTRARSRARRARSAGCRSSRRSTRSCRWRRTCACSRGWRRSPTPDAAVARMLEQTGLAERAGDELGKLRAATASA